MLLYLIRHGESVYNAETRIQGQLDISLSPLGLKQGHAVAASFRGMPIDAIFASPLSRARETAQPLADVLQLPLQLEPRLMEINAGIFQGHTWPEINQCWPDEGAAWREQNPDFRIPQGESRRELMRRAMAALTDIRERGFNRVVVVAHGGVLSAGLKALLDIPAERNPFTLYNGSISSGDWTAQFKLLTLNQMEHLHADGVDLRTRTGEL
jgi:probable phosphoglycerate mutase